MPLTLKPATGSGQMTLISVAGTTTSDTLTLPAKTGNIITSADSGTVTQTMLGTNVAGNGPAFYAYATAATSLTSTFSKVTLNAKTSPGFDTGGFFDATTNYRFQPTVAGYYFITGSVQTAAAIAEAAVYKNGSIYAAGTYVNTGTSSISSVNCLVSLNGSTDYVELWGYSSPNSSSATTSSTTYLQGFLARSA